MTDYQFLVSIRMRLSSRLSNFPILQMLDELLSQVREIKVLEADIIERLGQVCQLYTSLDETELVHVGLANWWPRQSGIHRRMRLVDKGRMKRLHKAGFMICFDNRRKLLGD